MPTLSTLCITGKLKCTTGSCVVRFHSESVTHKGKTDGISVKKLIRYKENRTALSDTLFSEVALHQICALITLLGMANKSTVFENEEAHFYVLQQFMKSPVRKANIDLHPFLCCEFK